MRTRTILLAGLLAGCTVGTVGPPPAPPVDWHAFDVHRVLDAGPAGPTAKERALAQAYIEAVVSPAFAQLGPSLDPGVHFAFPGMSDARGRDAVVHAHDLLFGAFDSRAVAIRRLWRTESAQALEWTMSGTQQRSFWGVPPMHKTVVFQGVTILWTKDDGSITDAHVYFDVAAVKAQLGVGRATFRAQSPPQVQAQPQVFEQTGSPDEQRNVATVRAALDALEATSDSAYLATMTDDVEVVTLERSEPLRGKEDLRTYFKSMHKAIAQLDTTTDNVWGVQEFAVVEYDIAGGQVGSIGWIPARHDRVVRLHVVDIVELREGKIARVWRYDNPGEILQTL